MKPRMVVVVALIATATIGTIGLVQYVRGQAPSGVGTCIVSEAVPAEVKRCGGAGCPGTCFRILYDPPRKTCALGVGVCVPLNPVMGSINLQTARCIPTLAGGCKCGEYWTMKQIMTPRMPDAAGSNCL